MLLTVLFVSELRLIEFLLLCCVALLSCCSAFLRRVLQFFGTMGAGYTFGDETSNVCPSLKSYFRVGQS